MSSPLIFYTWNINIKRNLNLYTSIFISNIKITIIGNSLPNVRNKYYQPIETKLYDTCTYKKITSNKEYKTIQDLILNEEPNLIKKQY